MIIDIHSHKVSTSKFTAIRSLTVKEAEQVFCSERPGCFSVGAHPWFADCFPSEHIHLLEQWALEKRFVAVGECGLDKNSKVTMDVQLSVFEQQIQLAEQVRKPLIIHCVGCFNELFELKKEWNPTQPWIIHGFRGKPQLAKQALDAGCSLSFGEQYNAESVIITPFDKLFVETDESETSIEIIYQKIANLKACSVADLDAGGKLFF